MLLLKADPTETTSVAEQQPDLFAELLDAIDQAQKTVYVAIERE